MPFSQFSGIGNISPEEAMRFASQSMFTIFGGVKNFDIWSSQTADFLANPPEIPAHVTEMGLVKVCPNWEMIDLILDGLELLSKWEYQISIMFFQGLATVSVLDSVWGHQIEFVKLPYDDPVVVIEQFTKKYGRNSRVTHNLANIPVISGDRGSE
jgi:hypothetical protein